MLIGSNLVALISRMLSSVILTRLLDAAAFGTVAIITTFSFIIVMLTDLGFYQYTVRSPRMDEEGFLDKVWTVRLTRDVAITVIFVLLSGTMASYVRDPGLQLAFAITSLTLITDGLSSMAFATAARSGKVGRLSLLDLIPVIVTIFLSIGFAYILRSYWALIISGVLGSVLKLFLSYYMFPGSGRQLRFDKSVFIDIWKFGRFIVPSSVITMLLGQSDKFLLIRYFSIGQFGLYSLASTLASAPSNLMNSYTSRILYPAFSSPDNRTSDLSRLFYEFGSKTRLLFIFLSCILITSAPVLVAILYDDRYLGAAQYLSILLVSAVVNFVISTETDMMIASGHVHWQLYLNILRLMMYAASSITLFHFMGVIGLIWAIALTTVAIKFVTTIVMSYLGIARLYNEVIFLVVAFTGGTLGTGVVLVGRAIWPAIPLPFAG